MKTTCLKSLSLGLILFATSTACGASGLVIAHRGASAYLPEHTLEAYALAHGMGADYIEQDLVLTKDRHFIALHDIHLEGTTDVEERFPDRKRDDGRWYAVDFSLAEVKTLSVHERLGNRFPVGASHFEVPTMEEAIELIQGLNNTTGRNVGIYPELKEPTFHREAGFDVERQLVGLLGHYGYTGPDAKVFIQCFEAASLQRIREELKSELPLVLLVSRHELQAEFRTEAGLETASAYINGVGPDKNIIEENPDFVKWAHTAGLVVHPYTIRNDDVPKKYGTATDELNQFFGTYGVDGIFSDFPDTTRAAIDALR